MARSGGNFMLPPGPGRGGSGRRGKPPRKPGTGGGGVVRPMRKPGQMNGMGRTGGSSDTRAAPRRGR